MSNALTIGDEDVVLAGLFIVKHISLDIMKLTLIIVYAHVIFNQFINSKVYILVFIKHSFLQFAILSLFLVSKNIHGVEMYTWFV